MEGGKSPPRPFDQAVSLELAQVVGKLVAGIVPGGESVRFQDGPMDVGGALATQLRATVHQNFDQSDDSIILDSDACHALVLEATRLGQILQERAVHFHVEVLGLRIAKRSLTAVAQAPRSSGFNLTS